MRKHIPFIFKKIFCQVVWVSIFFVYGKNTIMKKLRSTEYSLVVSIFIATKEGRYQTLKNHWENISDPLFNYRSPKGELLFSSVGLLTQIHVHFVNAPYFGSKEF